MDVGRVISAGAAAMRTDRVASVFDVHVLAIIEVFERQAQLNCLRRPGPLLLSSAAATAEEHVEWVMEIGLVRLVGTLLAAAIVLTALVVVAEHVVSGRNVFVFLKSIIVAGIFVWVILEALLAEGSLDRFLVSIARDIQNLVEVSFLLRFGRRK